MKSIEKVSVYRTLYRKYLEAKSERSRNRYAREAIKLIREAAYSGNPEAQYELGQQYEDTGILGDNPKRSVYWYSKAADQGHAEACNSLGYHYDHGEGTNRNPKEAIKWYRKGALLGSKLAKENLKLSME